MIFKICGSFVMVSILIISKLSISLLFNFVKFTKADFKDVKNIRLFDGNSII